ncbi:hypothetical protein PSR1_01973 [Anaeromyxobacter sp. PSR-1]|nr:hypothetical protein PSR1_01973 [Anaeromyxobacter sp. PSR-1]
MVAVSGAATGGPSSTAVTVIVTVAVAICPSRSATRYVKTSVPDQSGAGAYARLPSGFTVAVPCAGAVASVTTEGRSATVSFASTAMTGSATSSAVETASATATGAPLSAGCTVMRTVAEAVCPSPSVTWYTSWSGPS